LVGAKTPNSVRQALIRNEIPVRNIREGLTHNRESDGFIINKSVLEGCLLGDAGLQCWNKHSNISAPYFYKTNKYLDHIKYVGNFIFNKPFKIHNEINKINDHSLIYFNIRSYSYDILIDYYKNWYPESNGFKKIIPNNINIDEIVLLHWFLDDGCAHLRNRKDYLSHYKPAERQILIFFCSESFIKEDQDWICDRFNDKYDLGMKTYKYEHGTGWRIKVPQSKADLFYEIIGPPPVESLAYKWK